MTESPNLHHENAFARNVQLATFLRNPVGFVHRDHLEEIGLESGSVYLLSRHPGFSRALNRVVGHRTGTDALMVTKDWLDSLLKSGKHQTAFDLAVCRLEILIVVAQKVASIELYHHLRKCVKKSRRNLFETFLGTQAFVTSLREAPNRYPHLAEKGKTLRIDDLIDSLSAGSGHGTSVNGDEAASDGINPLVWIGLSTLYSFLKATDSVSAALFVLRFPKSTETKYFSVSTMTTQQRHEISNLLQHRGSAG
ncbi:hypothetical protein FIV00_25835 [Labrenzia sp. THAF82]|uniref:hypothetical protein n=1 Tax=Labrenzia sp. THAF82 TaxID=2587861 RepID=UPI001268E3FA|nr:hypothetical protein [Labrenzia sp. THAF82]QFT33943.1 hypothetical protein FIV00_25835 [Labrenzia sp. THAF82]